MNFDYSGLFCFLYLCVCAHYLHIFKFTYQRSLHSSDTHVGEFRRVIQYATNLKRCRPRARYDYSCKASLQITSLRLIILNVMKHIRASVGPKSGGIGALSLINTLLKVAKVENRTVKEVQVHSH